MGAASLGHDSPTSGRVQAEAAGHLAERIGRDGAPREELHYASVVFDSNTNRIAAQRPQEKEPDSHYSVIKKT